MKLYSLIFFYFIDINNAFALGVSAQDFLSLHLSNIILSISESNCGTSVSPCIITLCGLFRSALESTGSFIPISTQKHS